MGITDYYNIFSATNMFIKDNSLRAITSFKCIWTYLVAACCRKTLEISNCLSVIRQKRVGIQFINHLTK